MPDVRELTCPRCGGPLPQEAAYGVATCPFCGASTAAPPRVVERVVERIIVARDPENAAKGLCCPRCARTLEEVRSATKAVLMCGKCGGVWVDRETADYLARVSDPDLETAVRRGVGVVVALPRHARTASISCPVCEDATRYVPIEGSGQGVDVCDAHGTWFDRDELSLFIEKEQERRTVELSDDDLVAAGLPGAPTRGLFSRIFGVLTGRR